MCEYNVTKTKFPTLALGNRYENKIEPYLFHPQKVTFCLGFGLLEKITGKNDKLTPLQFLFTNCHPDFFIFPTKIHLEVEVETKHKALGL